MDRSTHPPTEARSPAADAAAAGALARLVDEQLELAAVRLPVLDPVGLHPAPLDHEEQPGPHPGFDELLLGLVEPTPELIEELSVQAAGAAPAPELSEDELARQALAAPAEDGADAPD